MADSFAPTANTSSKKLNNCTGTVQTQLTTQQYRTEQNLLSGHLLPTSIGKKVRSPRQLYQQFPKIMGMILNRNAGKYVVMVQATSGTRIELKNQMADT